MNVIVIYGAKSCEHDISLITGCLAKAHFSGNVYGVYLNQENKAFWVDKALSPQAHKQQKFTHSVTFGMGDGAIWLHKGRRAKKLPVDVAVNCCHGVNGEDGSVSALLQMAGIPNVESGVIASAAAMDKYLCKLVLRGEGLPVLDGALVTADSCIKEVEDKLGYPMIVKPATLGSSIGIAVANDSEGLSHALKTAFCFDSRVLVERALTNFYELNCSAMTVGGVVETSRVDRPISTKQILSFEDKYLNGGKGFAPKSDVAEEHQDLVRQLTKQIYQVLGLEGVVRVDYIVDKDTNTLYVNEINVVPGSLAYNLWRDKYSKKHFGEVLVKQAITNFKCKNQLNYRYQSTVLDGAKFTK